MYSFCEMAVATANEAASSILTGLCFTLSYATKWSARRDLNPHANKLLQILSLMWLPLHHLPKFSQQSRLELDSNLTWRFPIEPDTRATKYLELFYLY